MKLRDRLKRWRNPAQWRDDHPLTDEERAQAAALGSADEAVRPQHGIGAESYDRIDVERDLRKP
jgi:hypothetical protein